jgi:hypothetical protein
VYDAAAVAPVAIAVTLVASELDAASA